MSNKTYHDLVGRFNQILNGDKAHDLDNRKEKKMNKELEQAIAEIESNKEKELIKGYKVFNPDWTCRGFQFEVGEIFEEDFYPHVCYRGFHFCKDLKDCFNYYGFDASYKVAEVVALGAVDYSSEDSKCCTNKIGILHELSWGEVLSLVNTGEANTGKCNAGNHNTGDGNTGNHNTGRDNLGNSNTGDQNKGDHNTGDENSGNWNTGDVNKGDFNTGSRNSGNRNTGRGNEGDFNTGHNNASHHNTGDENSGHRNTGNRNSGNWNTGHENSGNRNTGDSNTGNYNTGADNLGNYNTGELNSGERNTGDCNEGSFNTGYGNFGDGNTGDNNTGNHNTGNNNSGDGNTGHFNKCNHSTGCFNTQEQTIYLFNKPSSWTYDDWEKSEAAMILGTFSPDVYTYPQWWDQLNSVDQAQILNLPNFDPEIFKEITGIDVTETNNNSNEKGE